MSLPVIEGTWEEIERRKAELMGHQLRVTILPEQPPRHLRGAPADSETPSAKPHRVSAMGKYAGILSSEEFMRQKQEEIDLEDRPRL